MSNWLRVALGAVLGFVLVAPAAWAQGVSPDSLWQEVRENEIPLSARARLIVPERYKAFSLNRGRLIALLETAPPEQAQRPEHSGATLDLPLPEGGFAQFAIVESPIMEPALAAKYPKIKTYLGQSLDDPTATVRFDVTPKGFHAQILAADGTVYIDPFQQDDLDHYIAYRKRDHVHGERGICHVTGERIKRSTAAGTKLASGATLRTYRLAMAATGEYTTFHGGTVIDGLAAIVTTMNRVNGIYEREVSVRMVLVGNNDQIIYTDAGSDPYANTSNDLNANQGNIDTEIGASNYDIGHLVGTGGGGVAQLGSVCGGSKARGLTGSGAPIGDAFDVDYVAHEMGHQFAGNHTFNGSDSNCSGGNRNASTAYEPGSGITIQAYAGICGADNLQPNSEDYFHRVSLNEILTFTTSGGGSSCGTTSATGNTIPTVTTTAAFTIPGRTPFTLTATGADGDGDALTYVWEEFDQPAANGANSPGQLDDTVTAGPIFRSFAPTSSPSRTFPSWRYILDNANVPPTPLPLPGTGSPSFFTGEVLPNANRTMNFRVTVRDNRAGGGGTNEANTAVTVNNAAGPFAVTAPNTAVSLAAGSVQAVTWNVAGTTAAPINTANVRITLSVDGGHTYPIVLLLSTPNDGSENVTLPAGAASTQARIRVEAIDNIYFDVSDANFSITNANAAPTITPTGSVSTRQGSPAATANVATVSDDTDAAGSLSVVVEDAPPELLVSVANVGGTISLTATASCTLVAPGGNKVYPVRLRVTDSAGATSTASVNVNVSRNLVPTLGTYANQSVNRSTTTNVSPTAAPADSNNNLVAPTVTPATLPGGGTLSIAADGVVTINTTSSTSIGALTVRASAQDSCGAVEMREFTLTVAATTPALEIVSSQVTTGNALIEPNECNQYNVTLSNVGIGTATAVSAVLSTSTPNVTITQANSAYADIPAGQSRTNTTPFEISSSSSLVCFSDVDLTLTVTYSGGGSPFVDAVTLPVGQAAQPNYTFTAGSGTIPAGGVLLAGSNVDDVVFNLPVPAGFNFSVYGTAVAGGATLRISTNGTLQLVGTGGTNANGNGGLPSNGQPSLDGNPFPAATPTLMPMWGDIDLSVTSGGIFVHALTGTAPNRKWVIEWRGELFGEPNNSIKERFAIEFSEGSSNFAYLYGLVDAAPTAATIGVQAASSGPLFTQYSLNTSSVSTGTRLDAVRLPAVCSAGSGACGGTPAGVTITQSGGNTSVAEGGATDSYSVVLNSQPSGTVTIALNPDAQVTTFPTPSLSFTTVDWNVPKDVTVTAVDDAVVEGAHSGTITHSASGGGYDAVSIASVVASITDNDPTLTLVNLAVSSQSLLTPIPGAPMSYDVAVENIGAEDVATAAFAFSLPPLLTNVSWVCVADTGAACPAGGAGAPSHSISLDAGTGVLYRISGDVPPATPLGTDIVTVANVSVSAPYQDSDTSNNTDSTLDTVSAVSIFRNGFENP